MSRGRPGFNSRPRNVLIATRVAGCCVFWLHGGFAFCFSSHARLAQPAERKALNLVDVGSSPKVCVLMLLGCPPRARAAKWTHWGLNPGPSAFKANVIPLHHVPSTAFTHELLLGLLFFVCDFRRGKRHRGDPDPCGQSPMDFESISLTARTQCRCSSGCWGRVVGGCSWCNFSGAGVVNRGPTRA